MAIDDQPETWKYVDKAIDFAVQESALILSRLRAVRAASDTITAASDRLHDLLGQIEQASSQSETTGMLGDTRHSVQASASTLQDLNADELVEHLRCAMRSMKELKFISMMIKIDSADPSRSSAESTEFSNDLAALVTLLDSTTRTAIDRVEPIHDHIRDAYRTLQGAAVGLTRQVEGIASQHDHTLALQQARDSQMQALSQEARQASSDTAEQISRLVPRLQFADAFVQRLQNARRFIDHAKDHPGTSTQEVLAVAAQQFQALCTDTRSERQASVAALDALLEATSHTTELQSDSNKSDGFGAWLQASTSAVSLNAELIKASHSQLLCAFQKIDDAHAVAMQVSEAISKFAPLVQTLKYTAINGSLLASKSSAKTGASYVLTAEIQSVGKHCGQRMTDSATALLHINDILARVDRSEIEDKIEQLAEGMDLAKAAQDKLQNLTQDLRLARQQLSQGVNALLDACSAARQTIQAGETMVQDLESLLGTDTDLEIRGITADTVQWITDYYTTEPERALHQQLFGSSSEPVVDSPDIDDELADFML